MTAIDNDPLVWIRGDMLQLYTSPDEYICQQLNCVAVRPHGLSAVLSRAFPYSDVYGERRQLGQRNLAIASDRSTPGHIAVRVDSERRCRPTIVGIFGQYSYGRAGVYTMHGDAIDDSNEARERYFAYALRVLRWHAKREGVRTIVFPGGIGCNLAGGAWPHYVEMLRNFARDAPFRVHVVCIDGRWMPV